MNIGKIFAFTIAVLLAAAPLTGCGFVSEQDGATLELNMDNSWRTELTLQNVSHGVNFNVGTHLLCSRAINADTVEYLWYDMETEKSVRFKPKCYEVIDPLERVGVSSLLLPDGNIGIMCNIYQNLGRFGSETHRRCIEVYDREMNYIETREMPKDFGMHPDFEDDHSSNQFLMDGEGNWIVCHSNWETGALVLESFNSAYECYGEIEYTITGSWDGNQPVIFKGGDGLIYMSVPCGSYEDHYQKIYRLNAKDRTCEETKVSIPSEVEGVYYSTFRPGTQDYDYYYSTHYGLYGVKDDERIKVIDWINSDFMPGEINNFDVLEDGTFILYDKNRRKWHATPRTQEEIDGTRLISLASVEHSTDLLEAVIDYNREESGWRIIVKDYSEYNTVSDPNLGYDTMKQDMLDGIVADIICPDGVNFESLATKGLFADWYDFMEADETFNREDYLPNFFEAFEYDEKLQRLGFSYVIETGSAKTEFAGDAQGMSLSEQLTLAEQQGIDPFYCYTIDRFAETWLHNLQTGCIDRKTAECYFNSPEFVQFLEYLCVLSEKEKTNETTNPNGYYYSNGNVYQNGEVFLNIEPITQPIDFRAIRRHTFFDSDITLVGLPMVHDEGNGGVFNAPFTVCINAQSSEHEAIWDFMKFFLSEDYQKHLYESLPIHEGAFEYKLAEAEKMVTASVGLPPVQTFIGELETWESDILRDYVHGIRTSWYYDRKVQDILVEETDKMLAGDQSPQEAAEMIQSRVSIYLSEQS